MGYKNFVYRLSSTVMKYSVVLDSEVQICLLSKFCLLSKSYLVNKKFTKQVMKICLTNKKFTKPVTCKNVI